MNLPVTHFNRPPEREIPAIIRVIAREDVQWNNRPLFKAPPLIVRVPPAEQLFAGFSLSSQPSLR